MTDLTSPPLIAVVGSLNLDLVVPVRHHATPGETVLGGDLVRHPGGKGANQAVAAARLGARVALVGRVGDDDAGGLLRSAVRAAGVDVSHVRTTEGTPSGHALITVDERAENAITVSPGANSRLAAADCEAASELLAAAAVTLLQHEVPVEVDHAAARLAGGLLVHNPAPALVGRQLPSGVDVLVPNRAELGALTGRPEPATRGELVAAARELTGVGAVVVTLGADGVLLVDGSTDLHLPARPVDPVDTTAAGDCFCGALAVALAEGRPLDRAARWAAVAAALSTTRHGAQPSLPTRAELDAALS
ncbi:ribokinase [Kitasatospora terrestris]|uniref:Ribokinase n=1 Tax=Kitasatospora terrestris TaxID=258051 RepID=A0ABP9EQP6_9ACTN